MPRTRTRSPQTRPKPPRRRRRPVWVVALSAAVVLCILPVLVLVPLALVPPPTTAFMLQHQWGASNRGPASYVWTDWDDIAPHAALAVIAAEDQRFFEHYGFDVDSLRDAIDTARRGGGLRGASTISQQVAKNLFLWPDRSFVRKGLEAFLTVELELVWSKRRILEVYLNVAEFGEGVFGVGAASRQYFAKRPSELTPGEAALLAAVLPIPTRLHAERPSAYVRGRQAWIQEQMQSLQAGGVLAKLD